MKFSGFRGTVYQNNHRAFFDAIALAERGIAPCAHCGECVPPGGGRQARAYAIALAGEVERCEVFCSPSCLVAHVHERLHGDWEWISHGVLYEPYFTFNGCYQCGREEESARYVVVDVPYDTPWGGGDRNPRFCSDACLLKAFNTNVTHWDGYPLHEKWFYNHAPALTPESREVPWHRARQKGRRISLPGRLRRVESVMARLKEGGR